MANNNIESETIIEEKPPFLSNWKLIYLIVFLNLVTLIIFFYLFTKFFE